MQLDGTNRGPIVFKALSVEVNEFLLEMCSLLHLIIGLFVHSKSESVKHFITWSCYNLANALACRDSRSFFSHFNFLQYFQFKRRNYVADLGDKKFTNSVRDIAWMMLAYASYRFAPHLVIVLYLLFTNKV